MCLTLPQTLISVVGIEKILPSWGSRVFSPCCPVLDAERMNPTPRPGRCHPETARRTFISCCSTTAARRRSPTRSDGRRCAASGARLLNVCPVYERTGGHAYGSPYRPIARSSPRCCGVTSPVDASCRSPPPCAAPATRLPVPSTFPSAGVPAKQGRRRQAGEAFFSERRCSACPVGCSARRACSPGPASRGPGQQAGGPVRRDQVASAAAWRWTQTRDARLRRLNRSAPGAHDQGRLVTS